ncbi:MAG: peptidoglycan-binding protein [Acidimicrobiales bacterium]|nr:peptidoglycan-binding protein [Acidimicrobiales bacterium]
MSRRGVALIVVVAALLILPVMVLAWLRLRTEDQLAELEPSPMPVVVIAAEVEVNRAQQVILTLHLDAPVVVAPLWSGIVTDAAVAPGELVTTGDRLIRVDGVDRIAAATDFPFWRPLDRGATGDDVSQLQILLSRLGYYLGPVDGVFTSSMVASVNAFATDLGVTRPEGVFDPGWVIWLPFEPFQVATLVATVGGPAPSPGLALLEGSASITEVDITTPEGRAAILDGEWILELGNDELTIVDGEFTDESIAELAALAIDHGETEFAGRIRLANPERVLEVPATAVTSNQAGALCVWVPDGAGYVARKVTLGGGRVARVEIVSGLTPGDQVLANPTEILDSPVCP